MINTDFTCQDMAGMLDIDDRELELRKAWDALLKEKREVEAKATMLQRQEAQFQIKWDMLITETQQLAEDKKKFEIRKKFFDEVQYYAQQDYYESPREDNIVHGEMFFSGVSDRIALKKRYRDLIKIYHPDEESGDDATVAEINREYQNLRQSFN